MSVELLLIISYTLKGVIRLNKVKCLGYSNRTNNMSDKIEKMSSYFSSQEKLKNINKQKKKKMFL